MKKVLKRIITASLTLVLVGAMLVNLTSCGVPKLGTGLEVQAADLMEGLDGNKVEGKEVDSRFISNTARFSIDLFKRSIGEENSLISPLSVMLALAMTANGADNQTLEQMEKLLGGDMSIDELNEYLFTYAKGLPNGKKSKFGISNSIWFRDDGNRFLVEKDFLQKNADYYNANAYKSAFDAQTLKDINNWVKHKTDGMIDEILDSIDDAAVMFLLNAIVFDAEWETIYNKNSVNQGVFTNIDGSKATVDMMQSEEKKFIKDDKATGFIKPYKNGGYSFVAILPNEGVSINEYISQLTGESFLSLLGDAKDTAVNTGMPKFSYEYKIKMNNPLIDMGMVDAFDGSIADLSRLGRSSRGNLFIYDVIHKTYISVDEKGTKAGAVTKVEIRDESAFLGEAVILDRPFVYAIIDNATNLPIFIGTVIDLSK